MIIKEFESKQYNILRDVIEVDSLVKQNGNFGKVKEEIRNILVKYKSTNDFGLWLIHRHNEVTESSKMVENLTKNEKGESVLTSELTENVSNYDSINPINFRIAFENDGIVLIPLEYSKLRNTDKSSEYFESKDKCISEIFEILQKYGLHNLIGITLIGRLDEIDFKENVFIEESKGDELPSNVSTLTKRTEKGDDIETNWKVNENDDEMLPAFYCLIRCRRLSPGHSVYHWSCTRYV